MNTPCTCLCNCGNTIDVAFTSPGLLRHVKCLECSTLEHEQAHPSTVVKIPVAVPDSSFRVTQIRREYEQELWNSSWQRWQNALPEKFRAAQVTHPKLLDRIELVRNGHPSVASAVLGGVIGQGKTWQAVGFANSAIQQRLFHPSEVIFGSESTMLSAIGNAQYGDVQVKLNELLDRKHRLFVLDDVGRGTWLRADMRPRVFSLLLDQLWNDNRVLVATTNLTHKELEEYIGAAAFDRLRSMTGYEAVLLNPDDKRREITEQLLEDAKSSSSI